MREAIYIYMYATRGGDKEAVGRMVIPQEGQREEKSKKKHKSRRLWIFSLLSRMVRVNATAFCSASRQCAAAFHCRQARNWQQTRKRRVKKAATVSI